jgi:hypothetical protein
MALPAFLIPALTGFAISKLTGASTKKALQSALLGAAVGGITQGFGADKAATGIKEMGDAKVAEAVANKGGGGGITDFMSSLTKGAGTTSQFLGQKIPGLGDTTVGQGAYYTEEVQQHFINLL